MTSNIKLQMENIRRGIFSSTDYIPPPTPTPPLRNLSKRQNVQQKRSMIISVLEPMEENKDCICNRKMCQLLCSQCKRKYYGRIRQSCPVHPNVSDHFSLLI